MKLILAILLGICPLLLSAQSYSDTILALRAKKETEFRKEVLNETEAAAFAGFCHFTVDPSYRITATFTRKKGKKFRMPMTKERVVYYRQYGTLTFSVHDTICVLNVYENLSLKHNKEYRDYLFLPFRDGTSAHTTYGGGRYLDVYKNTSDKWTIDFNKAYHPYCVYSERYSCPIVPRENTITPGIPAGECYTAH